MLPFSEACERNKEPILTVISGPFAQAHRVLEIGSGTGQHTVHFARELPHLEWVPTELPEYLSGLAARLRAEGPANVLPPVEFDVRDAAWPIERVDAVFSANTLHIMSEACVECFFAGLRGLPAGAPVCIYGPFAYAGIHTSESNAAFDAYLRRRDPASGIRDFSNLERLAGAAGLVLEADHPMPANNRTLVWRKAGPGRELSGGR